MAENNLVGMHGAILVDQVRTTVGKIKSAI
jgi:hypothetical protein